MVIMTIVTMVSIEFEHIVTHYVKHGQLLPRVPAYLHQGAFSPRPGARVSVTTGAHAILPNPPHNFVCAHIMRLLTQHVH